jgi:hypothetical protein
MNIKIRICLFQKSSLLVDISGTVYPRAAPLNQIPRGYCDISRVKGEEFTFELRGKTGETETVKGKRQVWVTH